MNWVDLAFGVAGGILIAGTVEAAVALVVIYYFGD